MIDPQPSPDPATGPVQRNDLPHQEEIPNGRIQNTRIISGQIERTLQLANESFTSKYDPKTLLPLPALPESPPLSSGIAGWSRRVVASLLSHFSIPLAARWMDFSGATTGDRLAIASTIACRQRTNALDVQQQFALGAEPYIARLATRAPIEAMRVLITCPECDSDLTFSIFARSFEKSPVESMHLFPVDTILSREQMHTLWKILQKADPLLALQKHSRFLGIDEQDLRDSISVAIVESPLATMRILPSLPELDATQSEALAAALLTEDIPTVMDLLPTLALTESLHQAIARQYTRTQPAVVLERGVELFPIKDKAERQKLVSNLLAAAPDESLKKIESLLKWCGSVPLPDSFPPAIFEKYWSTVTTNRLKLEISDTNSIRDLLLRKVEPYAKKMISLLSKMNLSDEPWKEELASALVKKEPAEVPTIVATLGIASPVTRNEFFRSFARVKPIEAKRWAEKTFLELDQKSLATLSECILQSTPWSALKALLADPTPDQKLLTRVAVYCARENASRMCREFSSIPLAHPGARGKVFVACAQRNVWKALEACSAFTREPNDGIEEVFKIAAQKDPLRALGFREALGGIGSDATRSALSYAVRKNASQSLKFLATEALPEVLETTFACAALRRNARDFEEIARGLLAGKEPQNRALIVAAALRGDFSRLQNVSRLLTRVGVPVDGQLAAAFALERFSTARSSALEQFKSHFSDREFILQIVSSGILSGRWDSALDAARHLSHLQASETDVVDTNAALAILDATCASIATREDLTDSEKSNLTLLQRIRTAQCIPTDTLQRTLDHFGEDDYEFLFEILHQGGSTVAESTFELLLSVYKIDCDISEIDRTIIRESVANGFRGLSPTLLADLRPIFNDSVYEGRAALKNYRELAGKILQGLPIPASLERSPLYPGLVTQAYRPVGMTEGSVKRSLEKIEDNSSHLSGFSYPTEGYGVRLAQTGQVTIRPGQSIAVDVITELQRTFHPSDSPTETMAPYIYIRRLLEGGFDQLQPADVWHTLRSGSADPRISDFERKCTSIDFASAAPRSILSTFSIMSEALSVVAYDATIEIATNITKEGSENCFNINKKVAAHVRRILRLPQDREVTRKELLIALDVQAQKLFKKEQGLLNKESRKFNLHIGALKDRYVMYVSKSKPAYFGRAGAGLCTANDTWSWNSKTYLQMMLVDTQKNLIVGNIQLHLFRDDKQKPAVLARLNPTSTFLRRADNATLASEMLRVVRQFAAENDLVPYLPEQTAWHQLTNRNSFAPHLKKFYGKSCNSRIQITSGHSVTTSYQLLESASKKA